MVHKKQLSVSNLDGSSVTLVYFETPDECPICLRGTNPREVSGVIIGSHSGPDSKLRLLFQCTWRDCSESFLGYYSNHNKDGQTGFHLDRVAPKTAQKGTFPESVEAVSPDFVAIHNQALAAEAAGFDEISGIGLRKSLEFLIKDFCINQHPTETTKIKKMDLGPCIKTYCDDVRLVSTASRAAWLGNDEAHYIRRWLDKDVNDLKTLTRVSVNWIENVLLTQQYDKEMDDPKKTPKQPGSSSSGTTT
jgi:hypothetical protein